MANPIRRAASLPSSQKSLVRHGWEVADPGYTLGTGNSDWSHERAVEQGFRKSHLVYACVRKIAQAASSVPWIAVRGSGDDREDLPDHELTKLLSRPNEYTSGHDFMERITGHLHLGGNAILVKSRDNRGRVKELWPIQPDHAEAVEDNDGMLLGYNRTSPTGRALPSLRPRNVTHLQFGDPARQWWGMSPLQAVAQVVDTDIDAVRWNRVALKNRAVPDGILTTDNNLSDEQFDRLQEQQRRKSGSGNAREALILEAGLGWQQMSLSPAEMDFVNSRQMSREDILMVFGVPPAMLGIVQSATQSDVGEMRLQFWLDTVLPYLAGVQAALNLSLAPEFGGDISVRPDTSEVRALQIPMKDRVEQAARLHQMGTPLAEINRVLELGLDNDALPGGDTGYLPASSLPVEAPRDPLDDLAELGDFGAVNANGTG